MDRIGNEGSEGLGVGIDGSRGKRRAAGKGRMRNGRNEQ